MTEKLEYEIKKIREEEFRKGYSYGFQDALRCFNQGLDLLKLKNKIFDWRADLTNMKAPPVSKNPEMDLEWCNPKGFCHL
jgi:hypothetical protein